MWDRGTRSFIGVVMTQVSAPLNARRAEIIQKWNLDRVRARVLRDTDLTSEEVEARIREYRNFLTLLASFAGTFPVSKPIDVVWHTHMLFVEDYEALSKQITDVGRISHVPTLTDEDEAALLPLYQERTLPALARYFGDVNPALWPRNHCVCGGNGGGDDHHDIPEMFVA